MAILLTALVGGGDLPQRFTLEGTCTMRMDSSSTIPAEAQPVPIAIAEDLASWTNALQQEVATRGALMTNRLGFE